MQEESIVVLARIAWAAITTFVHQGFPRTSKLERGIVSSTLLAFNNVLVAAGGQRVNVKAMNKLAKILVTVVALFIFFLLFAAIVGSRSDAGHQTPGFLGVILFAALIGGIRAIWKSGKDSDKEDNGNSVLQK